MPSNGQYSTQHGTYSVPAEANNVLHDRILNNPLIQPYLPKGWEQYADKVVFEGSDAPSIPINWRFAESVASLKGYEAVIVNAILAERYGHAPVDIHIDTDHAQLFIMSAIVVQLHKQGKPLDPASTVEYFPNCDKHGAASTLHRSSATNIYKTKDGRFFHIHGSMDSRPTQKSLNLPEDMDASTHDAAIDPYVQAVARITADEMQTLATDKYKQAGTICYSVDEYNNSEHGRANEHVGLFEIHHKENVSQKPCWWAESPQSSPKRPLAGLKVVDMSRVIAAPAVSRELAELGASVMRIVSPNVTDMSVLHVDLNQGKWNAYLDLKVEADREKLRDLLRGADVFLQGYRPYVLDKYGFSEQDVHDLVEDRAKGIVYARENTYGWNGPWKHRTGWQQISDANCGVSLEFGRAMGNDEPVTPVFPNSDYCTGIAGAVGIMTALLQRSQKGGSYTVDIALNYYSRWLTSSVGTYPEEIWQELYNRYDRPVYRHTDNMQVLFPDLLKRLHAKKAPIFQNGKFFREKEIGYLDDGVILKSVAPILRFPGGEVEPGFHVSTRTNGVDQPYWPVDLTTEIVE